MVQSLRWNCTINILAAIQDTTLTVWYYPAVIFSDKRIVEKTCARNDSRLDSQNTVSTKKVGYRFSNVVTAYLFCSDFGKNPVVVSFVGNHIGVRRVDGSLVNSAVPMTVTTLHEFASTSRWEDARKLCRLVKVSTILAKKRKKKKVMKLLGVSIKSLPVFLGGCFVGLSSSYGHQS